MATLVQPYYTATGERSEGGPMESPFGALFLFITARGARAKRAAASEASWGGPGGAAPPGALIRRAYGSRKNLGNVFSRPIPL